jgi:hypothetical protein
MCIFLTMPFHTMRWYAYAKYVALDVLKIKLSLTSDEPLIETGYILANHRSWTDFCLDPFLADSAIIGRRIVVFAVFWNVMIGYPDNRIFSFVRGKETRTQLFHRIKQHFALRNRILFFPEGTRMKYTHLSGKDDVKLHLKYGLLKEIYYDKTYPVQIQISNNKELVMNEKKFHIQFDVPIRTHRTKAIYPANYATEAEFYDAIANEWYNAWLKTHV